MTQEQYDALQREIEDTTQKLKELEKQAGQSSEAVQKIAAAGEKLKDIGTGVKNVGDALTTHVSLPQGNILLVGGEAGQEAVDGVSSLQTMIQQAVASETRQLSVAS